MFPQYASSVNEIDISRLIHSKNILRENLEELDELVQSIREHGLLNPLIVRAKDGMFEIIAGHRRFEACKRLGWTKIPCRVLEADDRQAYEISLIENVQRQTLNPIEEAKAYKKYVEEYGWGGISQLAKKIGKSQEYISRRLALLNLPEEVKEKIMRRRINPSIAQELTVIEDKKTITKVSEIIIGKRFTVKKVRQLVKMVREGVPVEKAMEYLPYMNEETISLHEANLTCLEKALKALDKSVNALKLSQELINRIIEESGEKWIIRTHLTELKDQINNLTNQTIKIKNKSKKVLSKKVERKW
ncbi:MAG: ParB/RepB/Spo0J family partition protein [Candidatus Aenigmatarchaeota archaeon]